MFVIHAGKRSNKRVRTIIKTSRDPLVKHTHTHIYIIRTEGYILLYYYIPTSSYLSPMVYFIPMCTYLINTKKNIIYMYNYIIIQYT